MSGVIGVVQRLETGDGRRETGDLSGERTAQPFRLFRGGREVPLIRGGRRGEPHARLPYLKEHTPL